MRSARQTASRHLEREELTCQTERQLQLTSRECSLLACLVERAREKLTPAALLSKSWDLTFDPRSGRLQVTPAPARVANSNESDHLSLQSHFVTR
jgi:DNA-binding response OmpR family regulator